MAQAALQSASERQPRLHALIVPREHGAWGILLVPLFTGAAVGLGAGHAWQPLGLFTVAALALFWMRTPVESWLGASPMRAQTSSEVNALVVAIAALGSVAMLCLVALLWRGRNPGLFLIGGCAAAAFFAQAVLKKLGRRLRMTAQLVGAIGLTATSAGAYYVIAGRFDARALALWLANWIFAGNQIHFVQLRIHAARAAGWGEKLARGRAFFAGQFLMIAALVAAWRFHLLPALALLAFFPVLLRGLLWFVRAPQPLAVRRLGWIELAHAVTFGLLLVIGFLA